MSFFSPLALFFFSGPFMPHGHCYFWTTSLVALHAISDGLIVLSYYSIPVTLVYFVRRRRDLQFHWMFVCFAVFILACGTTHLMEIWNIWHGNYWLSGSIKAITAIASVPTAILLVKLIPQALALPSPADLKKAKDELEIRVEERTGELVRTTLDLEAQVAERQQAEAGVRAQLARLDLLNRITRATAEREDLPSILDVVISTMQDDLPLDFGCICLYDAAANVLTVERVGPKSVELAQKLGLAERAVIAVDGEDLGRSVRGDLVYVPNLEKSAFLFSQRLASVGLRSLVVAPLLVESQNFGVLVAARRQAEGFVSGECEFLKQLSEHVALSSHQSQLYTALQQAYDDLRQTQQAVMQQERLRALGQMASGIAHDINNAISPVSLYTESLLENEPQLSTRGRDYLQTIGHAIDDVAATVARMREFYRQREPQLTLAAVDLNLLVKQVVDLSRARWNDMPLQRGIVIKLDLQLTPNLPPVMGVESEIREALINLIFNGVDAMPEGGPLLVRTELVEVVPALPGSAALYQVQVIVKDGGVGMDENTRRRCLEPFFTTKGERGTGLGLAMVYGVVQRHSADLEIESAPGEGTTVRLGFAIPTTPIIDDGPKSPVQPVKRRLRILVVDDDPLLTKSLRDTLEGDGHLVRAMGGGQAGIDAFQEALKAGEPFSLVITDLGMPYVDGRKVASAVKAASPTTPVVLLTGWGQRLAAEGEIPVQVDRVMNKPPKLQELRAVLAEFSESNPL